MLLLPGPRRRLCACWKCRNKPMTHSQDTVIVIGAGIAGLVAALSFKGLRVDIYANAPMGQGTASNWSQGGVAAAIGPGDSAAIHIQDSLIAAADIADRTAVEFIVNKARDAIHFLEHQGVVFDHNADGQYALSREAAHSFPRVARVKGDLTGPGIMAALQQQIKQRPDIQLHSGWKILDLIMHDGRIIGAFLLDPNGHVHRKLATAVILATGGVGYLYKNTSNPKTAIGEGIAAAARAGALLSDLEFVQFHPTTMAVGLDPSPLATEALRGEGAVLINDQNERFMPSIHPLAELAPRDVVARAIFAQIKSGHNVFLDCRAAIGSGFAEKFPKVFALCQNIGLDPVVTPIPVEPAAHYHMGGVVTDLSGRTSIDGLWACGEVACTGAHGANRLASNSLLEAIVFGQAAATDIMNIRMTKSPYAPRETSVINYVPHDVAMQAKELALRAMMRDRVGVIRHADDLLWAQAELEKLRQQNLSHRLGNMVLVAGMIIHMALERKESRGSHYRTDYPNLDQAWCRRQSTTMQNLMEAA